MLRRDARVYEVARAAFGSAIEQVRANAPAAKRGKDLEATHQLRVGVRRLRVAVRLFKKQLEPAQAKKLEGELRWIFGRLGDVRDYDVLLHERIEPRLESEPSEALSAVCRELARERDKAARAAQRALASPRFAALVRALRLLSVEVAAQKRPARRARKWARKRLRKRCASVLAQREALISRDEVALHTLRKQLKKLRYTADMFRGLWKPKRFKRYVACLSALQDVLGPLNDAAVGRRLIAQIEPRLDARARAAARACQRSLDALAARQLETLDACFEAFERVRPFWA